MNSTINHQNLYYIQNGYIGNALAWWAKDSKGYSTDIDKAGKYSLSEVEEIIKRPQDVAWPCDYIDNNIAAKRLIVDAQYLDKQFKIVGNTK